MTTAEPPVAVGRDEGDRRLPRRERIDEDSGGPGCEPPEAALLPCADDTAHRRVVLDRGPRAHEREPPAGALRAPVHGPRRRRTAAIAHRRRYTAERTRARRTDLSARRGADETTLTEEKVEHIRTL